MGDHPSRGPIFPARCARCGGTISGPVSFCPHCGAHARFAFGDGAPSKKPDVATAGSATARAASGRADVPLGELLWPSRPTPLFNSADTDPYGEAGQPSFGGARHWGVKTGIALASLAFLTLYGGAVLLHRYDDTSTREQQAASNTAQGRVTTIGMGQASQTSTTAQGPTVTAAPPPARLASSAATVTTAHSETSARPVEPAATDRQPESVASVVGSVPAPPPAVVTRPSPPSSTLSQNKKASSLSSTSSGKQFGDKNRRLMSLALARAHSGLEKNDLRMARSGVYWALSLQPGNSEAIKLKEELLSREKAHLRH